MNEDVLNKILQAKNKREKIVLATNLNSGKQHFLNSKNDKKDSKYLKEFSSKLINGQESSIINIKNESWYIDITLPPLRLVIIGAVHIAQPLATIASNADFEVIIIDPRSTFATEERFPKINIIKDWPGEALKGILIDERTAVATLTHDPKLDDSALEVALRSKAFYIGSLGSIKTHNSRILRLKKIGFTKNEIKRINGPIGIKIGAKSPNEIAISIMAQIISKYRTI